MRNIEDTISFFVKNQFPSFYEEQGPSFVEFVKQYYKYLEQTGNPLFYSRNLLEYRDVDKTIDSFIVHFKEKYLKYFPYELAVEDARFLVKHIMDFYRSKGSERSYEIFFRSIYNATPTLYYPKQDLFKLSDGSWYKPVYLEVKKNSRDLGIYVGKTIVGSSSQATAFVEAITTKRSQGRHISVVYLSGVQGNFVAGEVMTIQSDPIIEGSPLILGSLTSVDVITGGENFSVGDELRIVSGRGSGGILRVSQISTETGIVKFILVESGFGFTNTAAVLVSQKTMDVLQTAPASNFKIFDTISQPLATIEFNTATGTFNVGDVVNGFYANNWLAGNGTIINVDTSGPGATNGIILVSTHSGNVANGSAGLIYKSGNTVQAVIDVYTDSTATGNCIGTNTTSLGVINVHSNYEAYPGNYIHGSPISLFGNVNVVYNSTSITGNGTEFDRELANGDIVVIDTIRYHINTITSNTSLTITAPYIRNTANGVVMKKFGYISYITDIGLGSGAQFNVGDIGNPESVRLDYTFLKDRNVGNVAFMDMTLDALNSNTAYPIGVACTSFNALSDVSSVGDTISIPSANSNFSYGAAVTYVVASGNTAVGGLIANTSYYISFANSSSIKLSNTLGGANIDLTASLTNESGHYLRGPLPGYGFWKYPGGDKDAILLDCFDIDDFIIGSVESLVSLDGGENYTKPPFIKIYENKTGGYDKRDWIFNVTGAPRNFTVGEIVEQTSFAPATVLTVSSYGGNTEAATPGEYVYQSNGSANVATGYLYSASIGVGGSGSLTLVNVAGSFTTSYQIKTLSTNANAVVGSVSLNTLDITGRAIVKEDSNTSVLHVKRLTFFDTFTEGSAILGTDSGVQATLTKVIEDKDTLNIGNNCIVTANVTMANGTIVNASIVDSGIGYIEDEIITAINDQTSTAITVKTHTQSQGTGRGFYKSAGGFASHDKYLHDGDYYQTFSYDIRSKVPFDIYKDVLKQVIHVAGTKLFGTFVNDVTADLTVTSNTTIDIIT